MVDGVYLGHGPYRFLVDTATTSNHIEPGSAQAIGLTALGEARADRQEFLFAGMEVVHRLSRDIQGILGQAFLSHFDYLLDSRGKRLEFGKQSLSGRRARLRNIEGRPAITTSLGGLVLDSGAARR